MKKLPALLVLTFACFMLISNSSCNRGTGCPINENAHVQPNKKGDYKKSKTRSGLFPKKYKRRG